MKMIDLSLGDVEFDLPRTFTLKNWPFFVLLAVLGGVPAAFFFADDRPLLGMVLFVGVSGVPVGVVLLFGWLGSLLVGNVRQVCVKGLVVSWRGRLESWTWPDMELTSDHPLTLDGIYNRSLTIRH